MLILNSIIYFPRVGQFVASNKIVVNRGYLIFNEKSRGLDISYTPSVNACIFPNVVFWGGIPPKNGAQLAIDTINAHGGVGGIKLALNIEDTRCEPKDGVSAFNKLTSIQSIKIILGEVCSSVTLAVAPLAEKNRILLISPASTNPKITSAGDFIFRVIPSDDLRGKVFAEYIFSDVNIKQMAILYINNEGGIGNRNSFKERFTQLGGQVVTEEAYPQNTTDLRAQITKIKNTNAKGVLVVSYPQDTIIVLKQARELNLSIPLYFQTEAVEDSNVLREAGNTSDGVVYILPAPATGGKADKFAESYENKYGKKPELFAAEAYDIIELIAAAITANHGKEISAELIRDYLYSVRNFQGASGSISFDKNGDVIKPMAIKRIVKGAPQLISVK